MGGSGGDPCPSLPPASPGLPGHGHGHHPSVSQHCHRHCRPGVTPHSHRHCRGRGPWGVCQAWGLRAAPPPPSCGAQMNQPWVLDGVVWTLSACWLFPLLSRLPPCSRRCQVTRKADDGDRPVAQWGRQGVPSLWAGCFGGRRWRGRKRGGVTLVCPRRKEGEEVAGLGHQTRAAFGGVVTPQ